MEAPKIFISYSWSSKEHVVWILDLAKKLVDDNVDVYIDRWSLKPGQDKYDFMEKMVKDDSIKKVLIICDKQYADKANERKSGVGIESQIISPKIYDEVNQEKFIPIISEKDEHGKPYIPIFLKSRIYIDLSDITSYYENYEELLRNIYNKPLYEKPPLGKPPTFILDDNSPRLTTSHKFLTFKDAVLRDKNYSVGLANDYLNEIISFLENHKVDKDSELAIDEEFLKNINEFLPLRNEFIDFILFVNSYKKEESIYNSLRKFFSSIIKFIRRDIADRKLLDNYKFIAYELFLYAIAILIKDECFEQLHKFVNELYYYEDSTKIYSRSDESLYHYTAFQPYIETLEVTRKNRLKLNVYNVTSGILKERENQKININHIIQADYFLFIHSLLNKQKLEYIINYWYPYTLLFAPHGGSLPLFVKATSKEFFNRLLTPLNIKSKDEFVKQITFFCENDIFPDMQFLWGAKCDAHKSFLNIEKISSI